MVQILNCSTKIVLQIQITNYDMMNTTSFVIRDSLKNIPLLESSIELSCGINVSQFVLHYFIKCFEANPEIRFDGHLSNIAAAKLFLYWLIQYRSEKEIGKPFHYKVE